MINAGIHTHITAAEYHSDPCPEPSLSRSVALAIARRTPRHGWTLHPRLNPDAGSVDPAPDRFNLGSVAHELLMGKGIGMRVIDAPDWRSKAARESRDDASEAGMIPILRHQYDRACEMVGSVMEQLPGFGLTDLFDPTKGSPESVIVWRDETAGWSRCMVDWMTHDLTMWDVKTTSVEMTPESLGRHCAAMNYEFQAAFYERGLCSIHPDMRGRVQFYFLFVEASPPYAVLPVMLPNDAMAKGRHDVARACELWAAAKASGQWPMYSGGVVTVDYPPWHIAEFHEYAEGGDEDGQDT